MGTIAKRQGVGPTGLYVHVPFCVRKCHYCDFYSLPRPPRKTAPDAARYLAALERELEAALPPEFRARTVYVGGGTPTELGLEDLARLLDLLRGRIDPCRLEEWTVESNPGTLTREKARVLRDAGVTRVSIGVQSFDPENLAMLGRRHSPEEAVASVRLLRDLGFTNINLDLIFGIPGSSRERLRRDLAALLALEPEHVACYALSFEAGTPIDRMREQGVVSEVDDQEQLAQYEFLRRTLAAAGYVHYEISNFARPGLHCRHNLLYWGAGEYYGVGPAAHSHVGGARTANDRDLEAYCDALLAGRPARAFEERLEPERWAREALVMALRRLEGVRRDAFRAETGWDYLDLCGPPIERLVARGLLDRSVDRIRLTERALFVSDTVFLELV